MQQKCTIKSTKRENTSWEKIFAKHKISKRLISRNAKKYSQVNKKITRERKTGNYINRVHGKKKHK